MNRHFETILAVVAILFVALGCGKSEEEKKADAAKSERGPKFYKARLDLAKKPAKTALVQEPFIKGTVVVLTSTDGSEPVYAPYPPMEFRSLEANSPEELGTVVLEECRSTQKGVYRTKEDPPREVPAMAIDCDVSLIDHQARAVYFVKKFEGKLNEQASISQSSNSVYKGPNEEINKFLGDLPRK
ncbi:MAG: hypothetical protein ABL999_16635 [Pyrinomonadaceae bacterium]